jgi:hypothetical protein
MPRTYPCPHCEDPITTFMIPGESATCDACGGVAVVPEGAVEADGATRRPFRERNPEREWLKADTRPLLSRGRLVKTTLSLAIGLFVIIFKNGLAGDWDPAWIVRLYPLQFCLVFGLTDLPAWPTYVLTAVISIPWYPLLVYLLLSSRPNFRICASLLLVVQGLAWAALYGDEIWTRIR